MDNELWITKGEGLVKKISGNKYSNDDFIKIIEEDDSVMGSIMKSFYSSPTIITLASDKVPENWVSVNTGKIDTNQILNSIQLPEEIPASDRLRVTKSTQSDRIRYLMNKAYYNVSTRGIKDRGIPESANDILSSIIYVIYHNIEKSTTAAIKNKKNNISNNKRSSIREAFDIVNNHKNVDEIMLGSIYVEPCLSTIKRIYLLKSIYGDYAIDAVINNMYYQICKDQVEAVKDLYKYLVKEGILPTVE